MLNLTVVKRLHLLSQKLRLFSAAIRIEHTLFALPFAYIGMFLAADGLPSLAQFIWITVAMGSARTVAMTANRIVHAAEDAANPRTAARHIPLGLLKRRDMGFIMLFSIGLFVFCASQLNQLAFILSPVAVAILFLYTYAKYFTWTSHFILGWADAIAPAAAWIGVTGVLAPEAVVLSLAVAMWIGGFDIIYACMDYDFDRSYGIHSIPSTFGITAALWCTRIMHLVTSVVLLSIGLWMELGIFYYVGWAIVTAILAYQNYIVRSNDLSRVTLAALKLNSYVGLALLLSVCLAVLL